MLSTLDLQSRRQAAANKGGDGTEEISFEEVTRSNLKGKSMKREGLASDLFLLLLRIQRDHPVASIVFVLITH